VGIKGSTTRKKIDEWLLAPAKHSSTIRWILRKVETSGIPLPLAPVPYCVHIYQFNVQGIVRWSHGHSQWKLGFFLGVRNRRCEYRRSLVCLGRALVSKAIIAVERMSRHRGNRAPEGRIRPGFLPSLTARVLHKGKGHGAMARNAGALVSLVSDCEKRLQCTYTPTPDKYPPPRVGAVDWIVLFDSRMAEVPHKPSVWWSVTPSWIMAAAASCTKRYLLIR
jgi:hypothetical protein